jgi:hypothetical protein
MSAPAYPDRVSYGGSVGDAALTSATMIVGIDRLAPPTERLGYCGMVYLAPE